VLIILDETTGTDQNNLSDYNISHRSSKKGYKGISNSSLLLVENRTNAFDNSSRLPGLKNHSRIDMNPNSSVSNSQDDSEDAQHTPLPPIKPTSFFGKEAISHIAKAHLETNTTLKTEHSHQSLANKKLKGKKKYNEDGKMDRAKIFKKTFINAVKGSKKKRYIGA